MESIIIVLAAIAFMILERFFPYNRGQKLFREGFWVDMIWYSIFQSYVVGMIIAAIIRWIDSTSDISRLHLVTAYPIWAQLIFFIVLHDFYVYCLHRLQHAWPLLWRTHEAHHATEEVDWLSGVRSHPLESIMYVTVEFAPIIILGAAPEVAIYKGAISAIWGMYIHSNLNMRMGKLQYIFNGPEMHRWHHASNDERAFGRNFGTKLAIWDWIFRTRFLPPNEKANKYGISEPFPAGYFQQVFYMFRSFKNSRS